MANSTDAAATTAKRDEEPDDFTAEERAAMKERIHAAIKANVPELAPKTWYGMPAYAKDGKVVCFFQSADKFKARYATFGFNDTANIDDGAMWATSWARS